VQKFGQASHTKAFQALYQNGGSLRIRMLFHQLTDTTCWCESIKQDSKMMGWTQPQGLGPSMELPVKARARCKMEPVQRESTRFTENEFISKLKERLPGLNDERALAWAAAAIKHLAQNLDDRQRNELLNALHPKCKALVLHEGEIVKLFGKETPSDFFVDVTEDAGSKPSELGGRKTVVNALSVVREHLPSDQALDIERDLPPSVAEIWHEAARPNMQPD
jgi:hypothetical protein